VTTAPAVYVPHAPEPGPDRPTVVVVPGLAVSRYLRPVAHELARAGARCELLDLPGFGRSGDPPAPLDLAGCAAVVAGYLRERAGDPVALVGHSSGTQIAALAAVASSASVAELVLASPTIDPRYRLLPRLLLRWLADGRREPAALTRTQLPEWRRAGLRRIQVLLRSLPAHHLEDTIAELDCPVTVIRAGRDPLCTSQWAAQLAAGHRLITVPGLPHAFPYHDPAGFAELILAGRPGNAARRVGQAPAGPQDPSSPVHGNRARRR
jgi:pimeloyl-ACP methyl ester carboxylesterase